MKKFLIILACIAAVSGTVFAGAFFGYKYLGERFYDYSSNGRNMTFCEDMDILNESGGFNLLKPDFSSSDEGVFTVDEYGNIYTHDKGEATLRVDGLDFSYSCTVTVWPHEGEIVNCDEKFLCINCKDKVYVKGGHDLTELTCEEDSYCLRCGFANEIHEGHKFKPADCENPETCKNCDATRGEPVGHVWIEANCDEPAYCGVCSKKGDAPIGHTFSEATCTEDSKCIRCLLPGEEKAKGHSMLEATCTEPEHCEFCDYTEGDPLGHDTGKIVCNQPTICKRCELQLSEAEPHNFSPATCKKPKTCKRCNTKEGSALGHTKVEATCTRGAYCSVCNATLSSKIAHLYVQAESGQYICAYCGADKSSSYYSSYSSGGSYDADDYTNRVVELVNQQRAAVGLGAVSLNSTMCQAANVRAVEIATLFEHTRPDGRRCFTALNEAGHSYGYAGENIAYGYSTPEAVMNGWVNSPGHYANIVNTHYTQIGIGIYYANGRMYWTQFFSD